MEYLLESVASASISLAFPTLTRLNPMQKLPWKGFQLKLQQRSTYGAWADDECKRVTSELILLPARDLLVCTRCLNFGSHDQRPL